MSLVSIYLSNVIPQLSFEYFADLFLFCYERDFIMKSLTKEKRYDLIDAFNSTFRYLDDLLNIRGLLFKFVDFPHCRYNTAFIQC